MLWILQTNQQAFLDDCRAFGAYGVRKPHYRSLLEMREGDNVLLRLSRRGSVPGYVGPYRATLTPAVWASNVQQVAGVWQKFITNGNCGPRWLPEFPWCVFLVPGNDCVDELRLFSTSPRVKACEPIEDRNAGEILRGLVQMPTLPGINVQGYRTVRGVWVRSRAEYMIDNWFTEKGIVTYYEKALYLDSYKLVPDWFIPSVGTYLEYLGLTGIPSYDEVWSFKEQLYQKHHVNYATLTDDDLGDLDRTIPVKLPQLSEFMLR